jgi:hypothetical protein
MIKGSRHSGIFTANVINTDMLIWPPQWCILVFILSSDKMKTSVLRAFCVCVRFLKCSNQRRILMLSVRVFGSILLKRIFREELQGLIVRVIK